MSERLLDTYLRNLSREERLNCKGCVPNPEGPSTICPVAALELKTKPVTSKAMAESTGYTPTKNCPNGYGNLA
jgi:hypothetical protein